MAFGAWSSLGRLVEKNGDTKAIQSAQATQDRAQLAAGRTRFEIQSSAAAAFLTLLATEQTVRVAQASVDRSQVVIRSVKALVDAKLRPGADLSRADTELDATDILTAYAHVNGKGTVYIPVTKQASASTLAVIDQIKAALPDLKKLLPEDMDIRLDFDQSTYVTNSLRGLLFEAPGALVGPGSDVALVQLDQISHSRLTVAVPEANAAAIRAGSKVEFKVPAYPDRKFYGLIARSAHALDRCGKPHCSGLGRLHQSEVAILIVCRLQDT